MFDARNVRCAGLMAAVTLLLGLYGCRGNTVNPAAPSTPATSTTPLWTVTCTPVSLAGSACGLSIGSGPSSEPLSVTLTPETVDFKPGDPRYWEPMDFAEYTGPRNGASFVARQTPVPYSLSC